jgi:hypothetical protein
MRGPWPPRRRDFPEIDGAALGKANWVIMIAQTRARPQFAAIVLGRRVTSEDVETVTWVYAENAREFSARDYAEAINVMHRPGRFISRFFRRPRERQSSAEAQTNSCLLLG